MQCTCNGTLKRVRVTIVAVEKQKVLHIPSVSVALRIHAPYYISAASHAQPYSSTLSHNHQDFWKKKILNIKLVLISSTFV